VEKKGGGKEKDWRRASDSFTSCRRLLLRVGSPRGEGEEECGEERRGRIEAGATGCTALRFFFVFCLCTIGAGTRRKEGGRRREG